MDELMRNMNVLMQKFCIVILQKNIVTLSWENFKKKSRKSTSDW